jgi:putative endonuclease
MPPYKQSLGRGGEDLAVKHLQGLGYQILERNHRSRLGEIDIIARHRDALVFVEVKARRSERYGNPKLALTPAKRRQISMVALAYLKRCGQSDAKARFDLVTVQERDGRQQIEVITNAFDLAYP